MDSLKSEDMEQEYDEAGNMVVDHQGYVLVDELMSGWVDELEEILDFECCILNVRHPQAVLGGATQVCHLSFNLLWSFGFYHLSFLGQRR